MILNDYQVLNEIGSGRYSRIYKAKNIKNNQIVAIKKISKINFGEPDYDLKCANREIQITLDCQSSNVIKLYDSLQTEDDIFLILEICDMTLKYYIEKEGAFENFYIFQQFLIKLNNALKVINQKNIMHRDIKPDNIFINIKYKEYIPKLADFGISRYCSEKIDYKVPYEDDNEKHTGSIGTYHFISPEILKQEPYNNKCDLYSLGVTIYYSVFGFLPYEHMEAVYCDKLNLFKTGIESLDDLIERLLEINPDNRINFEEYFNHKFFSETKTFLESCINKKIEPKKENDKFMDMEDVEKMNKVKNIATKFIDIMELPNLYINNNYYLEKNRKVSNIIYYDENIVKHLEEIHNDSDEFENATNGSFLLCTNMNSLNFTMIDIKESNDKDHRIIFNLIVTGSCYEKVMNFLVSSKYDKYISNICIYCMKIDKYAHYLQKNKKIKGIYNSQKNVINFINQSSNEFVQPFSYTKLLTFHDYKYKYFQRHQKISEYYGDFTKETYEEANKNFKNFIKDEKEENLKVQDKNLIEKSFKTFDLDKDLKTLDQMLIIEYTKNTLYGDLNNWLRSLKTDVYEKISYYTARLMYSLNNYGFEKQKYFKNNSFVYRGAKTKYTNLLPFERALGKVVTISNFNSTTKNRRLADRWAGRENSRNGYLYNRKFSVIYLIKNVVVKSIPFGVNIENLSHYNSEEEILFQPFAFYFVKNVEFDYEEFSVDIELEVLLRKEILENEIKNGKQVNFDKIQNLIYIEN